MYYEIKNETAQKQWQSINEKAVVFSARSNTQHN